MFSVFRRRATAERNATSPEIDALRAEVTALERRIAATERLLRFVHGDCSLGGSELPPQPPPQPELRLKPVAALPGRVLVTME